MNHSEDRAASCPAPPSSGTCPSEDQPVPLGPSLRADRTWEGEGTVLGIGSGMSEHNRGLYKVMGVLRKPHPGVSVHRIYFLT